MTRVPSRIPLALLVALAFALAACGPTAEESTAPATGGPEPSLTPSAGEPTLSPGESATPVPATPSTVTPEPTPTPEPGSASPAPSGSIEPGSADACTGTDANREFFAKAAAAVSWPVYCAALPSGWFVQTGSYRLANGGKLEITYSGPSGARLSLSQGHFCPDASGCVPSGSDAGDAAYGDLAGTLVALDGGGWAIVVERGAAESWLLVATGIDEAATRALGEALARVDG